MITSCQFDNNFSLFVPVNEQSKFSLNVFLFYEADAIILIYLLGGLKPQFDVFQGIVRISQ